MKTKIQNLEDNCFHFNRKNIYAKQFYINYFKCVDNIKVSPFVYNKLILEILHMLIMNHTLNFIFKN